jgi:hypothetical protein
MAIHYCINPDVITSTTFEKAWLDVSGEPTSGSVSFTIYPIGSSAPPAVTVTAPFNAANYATSPELFDKSAKMTALIAAETSTRDNPSVAVLRQQLGPLKEALTIPRAEVMMGTAFNLPLSAEGNGALYVGNPNGTAAVAELYFGSQANPPAQTITVDATSVAKVILPPTQMQTNVILRVVNGPPVIVQAVLGTRFLVVYPI